MQKPFIFFFFTLCTALSPSAATPKKETPTPQQTKAPYPEIDDIVLGEAGAPITLIEYSSINCTHCASFHKSTFPKLKKDFIETGKVQYAFKHFPLDFTAVEAMSIIAKQPKETWFKHLEMAFETQKDWIGKDLKELGKILNISAEDCAKALACESIKTLVMAKRYNAEQIIEIDATPTFLILYRQGGTKDSELKHVLFNQGVNAKQLFETLDKIHKEISNS